MFFCLFSNLFGLFGQYLLRFSHFLGETKDTQIVKTTGKHEHWSIQFQKKKKKSKLIGFMLWVGRYLGFEPLPHLLRWFSSTGISVLRCFIVAWHFDRNQIDDDKLRKGRREEGGGFAWIYKKGDRNRSNSRFSVLPRMSPPLNYEKFCCSPPDQ